MHDEEHPLVVALAWLLAGAVFGVFLLVKLGAADATLPDIEPLSQKHVLKDSER